MVLLICDIIYFSSFFCISASVNSGFEVRAREKALKEVVKCKSQTPPAPADAFDDDDENGSGNQFQA